MQKKLVQTFLLLFFAAAGVIILSCNRQTSETPHMQQMPPEHSKMVEEFRKKAEESKKIIVAKVNNANISMFDLIKEMNEITPEYIKDGQGNAADLKEKVKRQALDRLIYRELAIQQAKKEGLQASMQDIQQEVAKIKASLKTEDAYRQKLLQMGLTEDELKNQIERAILVNMIIEKEIFDKVKLDPEVVKKAYAKNKASYKGPSGQMTFEEAKPAIEDKLMTPIVQKREDEWIEGVKRSAKIQIFSESLTAGILKAN